MAKKQTIKFRAVKVKTRPVKIEFTDKDGRAVYFKGIEAYEVIKKLTKRN